MFKKTKILIVEDDYDASYLIKSYLEDRDFLVDVVETITDGISYIKNNRYDILLLDLNLPDYSGFELLSNMKNNISIPTIVVSAYNDISTKVRAFRYGANDYLTKPINVLELEARIWALLSRQENIKLQDDDKDCIFRIKDNEIYFNNEILILTVLEFEILSFFIQNRGQTISREVLVESISFNKSHRLLDNHIKNIRKKIEVDNSKPLYLKTEYGIGYKFQ